MRSTRISVLATLLAVLALSGAALAGTAVTGKVVRTGWGKFEIKDKGGKVRVFHQSKALTRYEPATWRPQVGDRVRVEYSKVAGRSGTMLRADLVKLIAAGKQSTSLSSPVEVVIVEAGRTALRAKISKTNLEVRFARHRGTQILPAGWVPAAGERARIEFSVRPGRIGHGVTYVADKVERLP